MERKSTKMLKREEGPLEGKIEPLIDVAPYWERETSVYPDTVRITMADGKVVTYRLDVEQPHPAFSAVMEALEKLPVYGGEEVPGYKARHTKENLWQKIQRLKKPETAATVNRQEKK